MVSINKSEKQAEILAPAGNMECFFAAINAGADAVYMGLKDFNARTMTDNFEIVEFKNALDFAHKRNIKIYLTLNTLLKDDEFKEALKKTYELYKYGLDGVIVQDLGLAMKIKKLMPDLPLHASTQMSIYSLEQVKVLEQLGFKRVVLARELDLEEIKYIAQNTPLEIEVFVHGALCVSISGQCLMSALIGERSANRGSCAGPCRKKYTLKNSNGKEIVKEKYLLSKKDIFGLEMVKELIDAGVCSLKIEGRNKQKEYVAGVVRNYRKVVDEGYTKEQDKEVLQLFNRSGRSYGYLKGVRYRKDISEDSAKNTGIVLGKVIETKNKFIKVNLKEKINLHDGIEIIGKDSTIVTCIRDEKFNIKNTEQKEGNVVWLGDIKKANVGDIVYKTSDSMLNKELEKYALVSNRRIEQNVTVVIKKNKRIKAYTDNISVELEYVPEISKTSSVNKTKVKEAFNKTEETSVIFKINTDIDDGLFVPVSKLNELRKLLIKAIENSKIIRKEIDDFDSNLKDELKIINGTRNMGDITNSLYVYRFNKSIDYIEYFKNKYNKKLDIIYFNAMDFLKYEADILKYVDRCNIYFVIPNVTLKNETKYILENLERVFKEGINGVLLGNIGYLPFLNVLKSKYNFEIVADYSLNVTNKYTADYLKKLGVDKITPLIEANEIDAEDISKIIPIEILDDYITVMTTRYCVIASFAKNSLDSKKCEAECTKNNYYLLDEQGKKYDIITNNLDCISRLVRNNRKLTEDVLKNYSIRHCII